MTDSSIKKLSEYDITEIVYNTGVNNFNDNDLKKWIGKEPEEFLNLYVNDPENKIERSEDVLEVYYNGTEFERDKFTLGNNENLGGKVFSSSPLYRKKDNKKIGNAQFFCSSIKGDGVTYITCNSTYFLDSNVVPGQMKIANSGLV